MIIAINYANEKYKKAQRYNSRTAYKHGADQVIEYGPEDIDRDFREKNKVIFQEKRGDGCWLWKPYIIYHTLLGMKDNDYLVYSDSGSYYINSIYYLIENMEKNHDEIMLFENFSEGAYKWTKRDVFVYFDCDRPEYTESWCLVAGYQVIKKSEKSLKFYQKWLEYCQIPELLLNVPNRYGKENYEGFQEHRNDQSILEILAKKELGYAYKNPSQFGIVRKGILKYCKITNSKTRKCEYPVIFVLHHQGKASLWIKAKTYMRVYWHGGAEKMEQFQNFCRRYLRR